MEPTPFLEILEPALLSISNIANTTRKIQELKTALTAERKRLSCDLEILDQAADSQTEEIAKLRNRLNKELLNEEAEPAFSHEMTNTPTEKNEETNKGPD